MHRLSKDGFAGGIALNGATTQRFTAKSRVKQLQIFRFHTLLQRMVLHDQLLQRFRLLYTLLRQKHRVVTRLPPIPQIADALTCRLKRCPRGGFPTLT